MTRTAIISLMTMAVMNVFGQTQMTRKSDDYYREDYLRNADYIYKDHIKTVLFFKEGDELNPPIIGLNSPDRLFFTFDDLNGDQRKYEYTIIHCDANWEFSDLMPNDYLESFTDDYIENYSYSVNTMQSYVHYEQVIPNPNIRYTISGNYLLKVYSDGDPDDVIFTRRFFVYDTKVSILANVRMPDNLDDRNSRQEIVFSIMTPGYVISDPYRDLKVVLRQNGRWDNAMTNLQPRLIAGNELRYDQAGQYVFDGGSDFRYFDMKSLRYNSMRVQSVEYSQPTGYQVKLHPDQFKKKNVYQTIQESINGRFLIKTEDMNITPIEADYATVHFFLPYDVPLIQGRLYLMGGLTDWQFRKDAEMIYDQQLQGFTGSLFLKQGFYNYQYILLPNNSDAGDVTFVEGNFWDTNNEYTFYVYHRTKADRYDKLINVTTIVAHPE